MLRELKIVTTISGIILTFLVTEGDGSSKRNLTKIKDTRKVITFEEAAAASEDHLRKRDKALESRFSNLLEVLEDDELPSTNGNLSDKIVYGPSDYRLRSQILWRMVPQIEILNLENKTKEDIWKEIYVDFSTLDTNAWPKDKRMVAKMDLILYANAMQVKKLRPLAEKLHPSERNKYDLEKFNIGIVALGVENFMKVATQFCEEEAAAGEIPIVSIGSGDGTVEKEIIAQYRKRFGKKIRIQLVDPDPKFNGIVDFKTVDHLIRENPRIVGNCVAFIIWPNPDAGRGDLGYDIEAIRQLQPRAVLIVYKSTGGSGSKNFRYFLHEDSLDDLSPEEFGIHNWLTKHYFRQKEKYVSVDNYAVLEVARQKILIPRIGASIYRMVKIMRTN